MPRYDRTKRAIDICLSAAGLLLAAPVMLLVSALVAMRIGRPILFKQSRPGKDEVIFTILKFRSMIPPDPTLGVLSNEQRMTKFGRTLRSMSLDELPSLLNVLRGDMSIVGPRPLRENYIGRYSDRQAKRHSVRPGLTGLAQVSGRNAISWDDRLELDVIYVETLSLISDLSIMCKTVSSVLTRRGISANGEATMSEFFGPRKTERMHLTRLMESHLVERVTWLNDPTVRAGITIDYSPTYESMQLWFERVHQDSSRLDFVGLDTDGRALSMAGLTAINDTSASVYLYVSPRHQGKGYGRETMHLLIAQARSLFLKTLTLETKQTNLKAQRLYTSLGFTTTGSNPVDEAKLRMSLLLDQPKTRV